MLVLGKTGKTINYLGKLASRKCDYLTQLKSRLRSNQYSPDNRMVEIVGGTPTISSQHRPKTIHSVIHVHRQHIFLSNSKPLHTNIMEYDKRLDLIHEVQLSSWVKKVHQMRESGQLET